MNKTIKLFLFWYFVGSLVSITVMTVALSRSYRETPTLFCMSEGYSGYVSVHHEPKKGIIKVVCKV